MAAQSAGYGNVHFFHLDVRDYASQLALFDLAHEKYGHVDVAVSCAAVGEPGGWFEPENLNLETVRNVSLSPSGAILLLTTAGTCTAEECHRYQFDEHPFILPHCVGIHDERCCLFTK